MSKYTGLYTFDVDNHRFIPVGQADGIIDCFNFKREPAKPLIKDKKNRKAIRAWAEANGVFEVIPYETDGGCRFWYITATKDGTDINLDLWGELPKGLAINRVYTITELCGEDDG